MKQISTQELEAIEDRLSYLNTLTESHLDEVISLDIEEEVNLIIETLSKAYKATRIEELGLKLVSP